MTDWEGFEIRECGEHRTTGLRAWCFADSEWCYPDDPCRGCKVPQLEAEIERLRRPPTKRPPATSWAAANAGDPVVDLDAAAEQVAANRFNSASSTTPPK